ncbi:MAG TPA: extracellular solute-binding protein, partial [Reyranella sp.]|nr:extracellular solute-binding protein [Reyranella sp.]
LMAAGVAPEKVYPIDIDKAFASYDKIKKDVIKWWDTGAVPIQLLTDREVVMTTVWNGRMAALQDRGLMRKAYEHAQFRDNLLAF